MSDICVVCGDNVRERQQGIQCDECSNWTHRTCGTGITQDEYRTAVKSGVDIPFTCQREHRQPVIDQHGATFLVQTSFLSEESDLEASNRSDECGTIPSPEDTQSALDTMDTTDTSNTSVNTSLNLTFNVVDKSIHQDPENEETSLPDETLSTSLIHQEPEVVQFEVIPEGSRRGKPLLVTSDGYRYSIKRKQKNSVLWTCSSRSLKIKCFATVVQKGSEFLCGSNRHQHGPEVSLREKVKISVKVKSDARANPYKSATEIGIEHRNGTIQPEQPGVPIAASLARTANRYRCTLRPAEPKDLNFKLDEEFLKSKDFLVADLTNGQARHMVFATQKQLKILGQTKRWFFDGTFKVIGQPFENGQLSSIHGFVKVNNIEKQVPLAFILMSRRRTEDYVKVLTSLKHALDEVLVENFVIDFEQAAWLAVRQVFPGVSIKGCVFHFVQAVWRKIQDLGLKPAYSERASIYNYLRLFMGLPFLPYNHIEESFRELASRANSEPLHALVAYMNNQWLNHPIFDIESWSVFNITVRTNNDVEGWHHRLNRKAGYQALTFYRIVPALRSEAESLEYELRHLQDGVSTRRVRPAVRNVEQKIQALWEEYRERHISTSELLRGCAQAYGPQCERPASATDEPMVTRL